MLQRQIIDSNLIIVTIERSVISGIKGRGVRVLRAAIVAVIMMHENKVSRKALVRRSAQRQTSACRSAVINVFRAGQRIVDVTGSLSVVSAHTQTDLAFNNRNIHQSFKVIV